MNCAVVVVAPVPEDQVPVFTPVVMPMVVPVDEAVVLSATMQWMTSA